jgi:hypothetical protein
MDIQVLNEIANLARQASLSQVRASVSANAQLKALKGSPVPVPGNPATTPIEDSPEQTQDLVTPDISSVARAASAYSAAVGAGLNSDELIAIQDLAGRVRTAVSDFLSQPGLEQAENAATVVASNPEAVKDLTANVEQAVATTLNLPEIEGEVIVNATPPNTDLLEEVPAPEKFISVERITHGAEPNNPVQVVAASPALSNAQAGDHARVETPVSRAVASPQPESVSRPEAVTTNSQETPVIAASPALVNSRASENTSVENPVTVEEGVETSSRDFRVTPASPALQNANAQSRGVENPVDTENAPATSSRDFTVTAASPALSNAQASDRARVETPVSRAVASPQPESVNRSEALATNPQETPVIAASPALVNSRASENTSVENPVNIPAPSVDQGQGSVGPQAQPVNPEGAIASPGGASNQAASGQFHSQPASGPKPGPAQTSDLFAQDNAAVNSENIRNVSELVNSVVGNEFISEAKKIFSEPKVIRTVADLADFILERLQEIIAANQLQKQNQSSGEVGIS